MLHLEICEGQAAMREKMYSQELGVTAATSVRLAEASTTFFNGDGGKTLFFGDSWFGSIKAAARISKLGQHCCLNVKTSHSHAPKKWLEEKMDSFPGGTWITLKTTYDNEVLYYMGYKYNKRNVLQFVFTEGAGSAEPGKHYEARFPDQHGNVHIRKVDRPQVLSNYFARSNAVDVHNQSRQHDLALEECWVTNCPWFRLCTTMIGFVVTDSWKLVKNNSLKRKTERIKDFSNRLAYAMLNNIDKNLVPPMDDVHTNITPSKESSLSSEGLSSTCVGVHTKEKLGTVTTDAVVATRSDSIGSKTYFKQIRCVWCSRTAGVDHKTTLRCAECGVGFCSPKSGRKCWDLHVANNGPPEAKRRRQDPNVLDEM